MCVPFLCSMINPTLYYVGRLHCDIDPYMRITITGDGNYKKEIDSLNPEFLSTVVKALSTNRYHGLMADFLEKEKIRKDLLIVGSSVGFARARGSNICGSFAFIQVCKLSELYETDREALNFVIKHEIAHIKNCDNISIKLVELVSAVSTAFFLSFVHRSGVFVTMLASGVVAAVTGSIFELFREIKADDFAINKSSDEELLGGRRFFKTFAQIQRTLTDNFAKRLIFSAEGNTRFLFDSRHPPNTWRIKKIERELSRRCISICNEEEEKKTEQLCSFLEAKDMVTDFSKISWNSALRSLSKKVASILLPLPDTPIHPFLKKKVICPLVNIVWQTSTIYQTVINYLSRAWSSLEPNSYSRLKLK